MRMRKKRRILDYESAHGTIECSPDAVLVSNGAERSNQSAGTAENQLQDASPGVSRQNQHIPGPRPGQFSAVPTGLGLVSKGPTQD